MRNLVSVSQSLQAAKPAPASASKVDEKPKQDKKDKAAAPKKDAIEADKEKDSAKAAAPAAEADQKKIAVPPTGGVIDRFFSLVDKVLAAGSGVCVARSEQMHRS